MRKSTLTVSIASIIAAGATFPGAAAAEERVCRGTIGAQTVDNIRVPDEASCTLNGTYAKGTVKVERAAELIAKDVRVVGNVQAENARNTVVRASSSVGGSFQVVQGRRAALRSSRVDGDVLLDENRRALAVVRNSVGGSVQVFQNTGGAEISGNRIEGNLQCKENAPPPTGGGNVVEESKEDQCARL